MIGGWSPSATQNTLDLHKAQDLQVAKYSSGFAMAHKMGLISISLGTKQVNTTYTDYVNNEATDGITNSTKITITASDVFSGNLPYSYTDGKYYFVGRKGTKPTFSTSSTGVRKWSANVAPTSNLTSNSYVDLSPVVAWSNNYYYKSYAYNQRSSAQSFSAKANVKYKIQCWGASGSDCTGYANDTSTSSQIWKAGRGAYTEGLLTLTSARLLYIYIGSAPSAESLSGGWNGGGDGLNTGSQTGYAGGGSTDIRITSGDWDNATSLNSRIMVAAGGGGSGYYNHKKGCGFGGDGGTINGYDGQTTMEEYSASVSANNRGMFVGYYGTQKAGGQTGADGASQWSDEGASINANKLNDGDFGKGGVHKGTAYSPYGGCGGGSGYWGGGASHRGHGGGGGGSSFISGYAGCVAISSSTNRNPRSGTEGTVTKATHYSGITFEEPAMIGGRSSMKTPAASLSGVTSTETGHTGSGYVIITEYPSVD